MIANISPEVRKREEIEEWIYCYQWFKADHLAGHDCNSPRYSDERYIVDLLVCLDEHVQQVAMKRYSDAYKDISANFSEGEARRRCNIWLRKTVDSYKEKQGAEALERIKKQAKKIEKIGR